MKIVLVFVAIFILAMLIKNHEKGGILEWFLIAIGIICGLWNLLV